MVRVTSGVEVLDCELVEIVGEETEVVAGARITEFVIERRREPLSRVSTLAISAARSSISSPTRRMISARCFGAIGSQVSKPFLAASTAASASSTPPRATSAIGVSSIGEISEKVEADATRSPPIQWSVETSTPSTSTRSLRAVPSQPGRSYPNGMEGAADLSTWNVSRW